MTTNSPLQPQAAQKPYQQKGGTEAQGCKGAAYVRPLLSAAYTRSKRSGCGTLGAGWATENILDTRESAGGFRGGPGGLKTWKLL